MSTSLAPAPKRPRRHNRLIGAIAAMTLASGVVAFVPSNSVEAAPVTYTGAVGAERIGVIGDSVMASIRWYGTWAPLRRFNYTVDVESCRRTIGSSCRGREGYAPDNTVSAMRRLRGQLGSVLVIGTGYDDSGLAFASGVDAVMAEAAAQGIQVVIWATMRTADVIYVGPTYASNASTFRDNNRILLAKASQYGGRLQVADWATYSASRREWVERDGIHLTPSGATAMAGFIADQAASALARISVPTRLTTYVAPAKGVGSGQVLLSWSPPSYTAGRIITDYAVQRSSDGGATWQTVADGVSRNWSYLASGLTNGQAYRFRVAAYTSAGLGRFSAAVTAAPRAAAPSAPTGVTAQVAPASGVGSGQVLVAWNLPAYTGGRAVTDYAIQRSADGGATWRTVVDGVSRNWSYMLSGLTNGHPYRFRVAAVTSAGRGTFSAAVTAAPRGAPPSAPTSLIAYVAPTQGVGSGQVLLSWSRPTYTGGRAVTDYAIQRSADGGATWRTVVDGVSRNWSYMLSGLTNGHEYLFRVAAFTSAGRSTYGAAVTAAPDDPALAAAPALVAATTATAVTTATTTTTAPATTTVVTTTTTAPAPSRFSVGDFVWVDADLDGVQDVGEPGLGGVVVRLISAEGTIVAENVSDSQGRYVLAATAPGPFTLEVVLPDDYQPTLVDVGLDDAIDSDVDPVDVVVGPIETTVRVAFDNAGEDDLDLDVGLLAVAEEPPTTDTTAEPTTTPTTLAQTTSLAPSTTLAATTTLVPTTETTAVAVPDPTDPVTVAPTTTAAVITTSGPAG